MPKAKKTAQMIHYGKFWKSSWCNFMLPDAAGEEIIIIEMYYAEAICISNYASYQTCRSGSLSWIQIRLKKKLGSGCQTSLDLNQVFSDPRFKAAQIIKLCFMPHLQIWLYCFITVSAPEKDPDPDLKIYFLKIQIQMYLNVRTDLKLCCIACVIYPFNLVL